MASVTVTLGSATTATERASATIYVMQLQATESMLVESWLKRTLLLITLTVSCLLFIRNLRHQRRADRKMQHSSTNSKEKEPFSVYAWSLVTFMWCIFSTLIWMLTVIPVVCRYMIIIIPLAFSLPHFFFSFYQLARLQAMFNQHRNDVATDMAYPKSIYIALNVFGWIRTLYTVVIPFALDAGGWQQITELSNNAGCLLSGTSNTFKLLSAAGLIVYLLWDASIVALYIYKLLQLRRKFALRDHRITLLLNKVLFLSLIVEISTVTVFVAIVPATNSVASTWAQSVGFALDIMIICCVLYLMPEHNGRDYLKLLRVLNRCGCLKCCCRCFGDLEAEYNAILAVQDEENTNENKNPYVGDDGIEHDGDTLTLGIPDALRRAERVAGNTGNAESTMASSSSPDPNQVPALRRNSVTPQDQTSSGSVVRNT